MLLHDMGEEGDPKSIQAFLEMNYPQITSSVSVEVLQILVGHLAENGRKSMMAFEQTIANRIGDDINDLERAGISDPEGIIAFLADIYTQMYGSQDLMKAVAGAGLAGMISLSHAVVRKFYQAQAVRYLTGGVRPTCPFQRLIRSAAVRIIRGCLGGMTTKK